MPSFECTGVAFKVLVLKEIKSRELPKLNAEQFMGYLNLVSLPAEVHTIDEGEFHLNPKCKASFHIQIIHI